MAEILFIKTSSLGDVIHHMPAVTEARARRPDARFTWVVEEAFAPLVRLHPAVAEVIPVALRRWRRELYRPATFSQAAEFRRTLRSRTFDDIVDSQGLVKSALIARMAQGRRHGYDTGSITERWASRFYDVLHHVEWTKHAIERNRALTGRALGYVPRGPVQYGLDRARIAGPPAAPYAVLLHATARAEKEWPVEHWRALAAALGKDVDLVLPWGSAAECSRSARIASGVARAQVPERRPLDAMAQMIAGAKFVIGVDTGLLHLAAALGVPLVAIFVATEPGAHGPLGSGPMQVLGWKERPPSVAQVVEAAARFR